VKFETMNLKQKDQSKIQSEAGRYPHVQVWFPRFICVRTVEGLGF
jgi:hypothetical protein